MIITGDHRHGRVTAETFPDENELLAAWNVIVVELEPGAPDSTEGPSSGTKAGEP